MRVGVILAAALLAVAQRATAARPAGLGQGGGRPDDGPGAAPCKDSEVLVQFEPGADKDGALRGLGASQKRVLVSGDGELVLAALPPGLAVAAAVGGFQLRADVRFVEPNYLIQKAVEPNDALWTSAGMWGMKPGFGSNAQTAWDTRTDCSAVYVGVVDEGMQYSHPDLAANVWTNPGEVAGDGIDNDGNGLVDDVHGFDFFNKRGDVFSAADGDAHGTHVAGTIGAVGSNSLGVAGVCHSVQLISAKFMGPSGGYMADVVLALDYITGLKQTKGLNVVATSNSWGCGTGCFSQAILDAINRGYAAGILFVAAAGNQATSTPTYPGAFSQYTNAVISVASLTSDGSLSGFSNQGSSWVHIGAPGSGILSTVPVDRYANYSGTSQATPHVTGAAALYKASYPSATADEIRSAILRTAVPTASLASLVSTGGRLDAAAVLATPPPSYCAPSCAANQYCSANVCTACPATCASCTSGTACTACLPGWTGPACSVRVCWPSCTSTQFCVAGVCNACPANCAGCTSSAVCTACLPGWSGTTCTVRVCTAPCASNQFCSIGVCTACPTTCVGCTSPSSCSSCVSGSTGPACGSSCGKSGASCSLGASCCSAVCNKNKKCA